MSKLRPPQLGSVEFLALYQGVDETVDASGNVIARAPKGSGISINPEFQGVEVGVRFIGSDAANELRFRQSANQLEERKRLDVMCKGMSAEQAARLDGVSTPEGERALELLIRDIFEACLAEVRCDGDKVTGADAVAYGVGLPPFERVRLMAACMGGQTLSRRQIFLAARAGDVRAEPAPIAGNE